MIIYRTAFKIDGVWHVLGVPYTARKDAEQRCAVCRQHAPDREVIVVAVHEPHVPPNETVAPW